LLKGAVTHLLASLKSQKMKIISEGKIATDAVESFFVTFFTDKESKGENL